MSEVRRSLDMSPNGLRDLIARSKIKIKTKKHGKQRWYLFTDENIEELRKFKKFYGRSVKKDKTLGAKYRDKYGYIQVYYPSHPRSNTTGCVYEHILIMESHLGRYTTVKETVHHINGVRSDNRIENLQLYSDQSEHLKQGHDLYSRVITLTIEQKNKLKAFLDALD